MIGTHLNEKIFGRICKIEFGACNISTDREVYSFSGNELVEDESALVRAILANYPKALKDEIGAN